MILYVNGDSHSAAAEAVNNHAFAEDDGQLWYMGRKPHPDNARVSWGANLANKLHANLYLDAESASSNDRILRTTREWLKKPRRQDDLLVVIQWSTWEREEWFMEEQYFQVNASGIDIVPEYAQERYREYVRNVDWVDKTQKAHEEIWHLHLELENKNIKHVFFNGNISFARATDIKYDWGKSYIDPYGDLTFNRWLLTHDYKRVNRDSYHFGPTAHEAWAEFIHSYIIDNYDLL